MTTTPQAPACPICHDTGIVQCPEQDGTGMYETACPEPAHDGQPSPFDAFDSDDEEPF